MKSAIALSMHKAGSSISDSIFTEFFIARGYEIDRISKQVLGSPLSVKEIYHQYQPKMKLEDTYYGIARSPDTHDMEIIPSLRVILQVRDPRDCITSAYFSFRDSHALPTDPEKRKKLEDRRETLQDLEINTFAIQSTSGYRSRMEKLVDIKNNHPDVLVLTYEEMVENTASWLNKISTFLDQPLTPELDAAIAPYVKFKVPNEDPGRHKRQITPGDHRRKLSSETIARMNQTLKPTLSAFGYSL